LDEYNKKKKYTTKWEDNCMRTDMESYKEDKKEKLGCRGQEGKQ
jgi:hypothetical protein